MLFYSLGFGEQVKNCEQHRILIRITQQKDHSTVTRETAYKQKEEMNVNNTRK